MTDDLKKTGTTILGMVSMFSFTSSALAVSPSDVGLHEGDLIRATGDNDIFI